MKNFESELDEIRIMLYEETEGLNPEEIINSVNKHAQEIACEFNIRIEKEIYENNFHTVNV